MPPLVTKFVENSFFLLLPRNYRMGEGHDAMLHGKPHVHLLLNETILSSSYSDSNGKRIIDNIQESSRLNMSCCRIDGIQLLC